MASPPNSVSEECEHEKFNLAFTVQNFGFLIGLDRKTGQIAFISKNVPQYLPFKVCYFAGKSFEEALGCSLNEDLQKEEGSVQFIHGIEFEVSVHPKKDFILVEFIKFDRSLQVNSFGYPHLFSFKSFQSEGGFVDSVQQMINVDRVMLYKFEQDGCGTVIAENNKGYSNSYIGLRFPAEDIPIFVRQLFLTSPFRVIYDVMGSNHPLVSFAGEAIEVDLTGVELRGGASCHLKYLSNMNVRSSFSVAVIVDEKLWGLVTCHHKHPFRLNIFLKSRLHNVVKKFSSSLRLKYAQEVMRRIELFSFKVPYYLEGVLFGLDDRILELIRALECSDMAYKSLFRWAVKPKTIEISLANRIVDEIFSLNTSSVVLTNSCKVFFKIDSIPSVCAGLMAIVLQKFDHEKECMFWIRPEFPCEVKWGSKAVEHENSELGPSRSFGVWEAKLRDRSREWKQYEIRLVQKIYLQWKKGL